VNAHEVEEEIIKLIESDTPPCYARHTKIEKANWDHQDVLTVFWCAFSDEDKTQWNADHERTYARLALRTWEEKVQVLRRERDEWREWAKRKNETLEKKRGWVPEGGRLAPDWYYEPADWENN
jgi:hypothetical protein